MLDFLVIGDVTIDHIIPLKGSGISESIDESAGTITIPFPSKVHLTNPPATLPGGNAFTVSMVLAKIGLNVAIYTVVGNDGEGEVLSGKLESAGVNCDYIQTDPNQATNTASVLSFQDDRTIFSYHYNRDYNLPDVENVKNIYLTSVGEDDLSLFKQVIELKNKTGAKLFFSPGSLQLKEDYSDIQEIMQSADVLILNKGEAQRLLETKDTSDEQLLQKLKEKGPEVVIMTKSSKGSTAIQHGEILKVGALRVETTDCTGAGDTYSATVAGTLHEGHDLQTAMGLGAINSASVVQHMGTEPGMLDHTTLESMYNEESQNLKFSE